MDLKKGIAPWILSACILGLSYPSFGTNIPNGILAWFAFVPILWATEELPSFKNLILYSLLFSLLFLYIDVWWLGYFSISKSAVVIISQVPLLSLPWIAYFFIHKKFGWNKALLAFPFLWTLSDYFHHAMPHGMQVYLLPYTQSHLTWLNQFIDITGMYGLTFWVTTMNVFLLFLWKNRNLKAITSPIIWLILPLFYALWVIKINPKGTVGRNTINTKVSIIQTDQDSYTTLDSLYLQNVLNEIVTLCDSAVRTSEPDLLVLPESSVPINLLQDSTLLTFTRQLVNSWQTSVAIGFQNRPDSTRPQEFENDALVFTPQLAMMWDSLKLKPDDIKVYQKEHGLPFVEVTPYFGTALPLTLNGQELVSDRRTYTFQYQNFDGQQFKTALSICWEQLFPEKIAALVADGAQFICLMNNDRWFEKSPGSKQLRAFTRLRAIENRRTIVRSSNGGISCFIDPFGQIYGEIPWFTSTIKSENVATVKKLSFYTKHPTWFIKFIGFSLVTLIGIFFWYLNKSRAK